MKQKILAFPKRLIAVGGISIALLFSFSNSPTEKPKGQDPLKPIPFQNLLLTGELYERAMKNFDRLEEEKYHPDKVFLDNKQSLDWPGDTEGRTVLGLVLDAQVTKREPKYLSEIIRLFPEKMNKKGYFGDIYSDSSLISEQQLASHGWVLRSLTEYYKWKKDPKTLSMIDGILANLVFPTKGAHAVYPIKPEERSHSGGHSGSMGKRHGNWILSTDTGCDFILLDGLTHAYEVRPSAQLKAIIDEMVVKFLQIEQVKIKAQTHATLTALRAIMRYTETVNNPALVEEVEKRYQVYKTEGMTENYENYNWYGRPEWTEPCAVVDSYILAVMLWNSTGKENYLEDAHHIYYNGLGLEQRTNGGFGIQSCAGAKDNHIEVSLQEAHWCCTMRGGEGLSRAAEFSFFSNNNSVVVPFYQNATATINVGNKSVQVQETTDYPFGGKVELKVLESNLSGKTIFKLYIPVWMQNPTITFNGKPVKFIQKNGFAELQLAPKKNDAIILQSKLAIRPMATFNKNSKQGYHTFRFGPHILVANSTSEVSLPKSAEIEMISQGVFKVKTKDVELTPLFHMMRPEVCKEPKFQRQILFKE